MRVAAKSIPCTCNMREKMEKEIVKKQEIKYQNKTS